MQTSEHLIAYQTVSLAAYQRLRETLIQQEHVFESVMTEVMAAQPHHPQTVAQPPHQPHLHSVSGHLANGHSVNGHSVNSHSVNSHPRNSVTDKVQELNNVGHRFGVEGFVLMCSPTLNVLLTAMPIGHQRPNPVEYRVGLTFDDRAIAVFIDRLKSSSVRPIQGEVHTMSQHNTSQHNTHPPFDRPFNHQAGVSEDDKIIAQKAFVLSWAKNLAVSPEGDQQPTQDSLDNQVQQSLLLDQVITRIRHSLDLPAILETTVAQVREFLSADRLVLYQFDHFKVKDDPLLATLPTAAAEITTAGITAAEITTAGITTAGITTVGRRSHSGHVTYESRATDNIPSVLHLSETECFEPSLPMRARYLMGKPIAVDNVQEKYAHIHCLLDFLKQTQVKSKIIAPIIVQDQLWGLLIAHQCEGYRHWEETEAIFLQHIAEHLAVAITQASLYQQLRQQTVSLESCVIERTQSLQDALMAAESAHITKGEFLSTMSHELRTPLTYIIGMSATLLRWSFGDLNDRQRSYLTTINQSGEQLLDVINNILEFASVESGRSILDLSELSLRELMNTLMADHKGMAAKKNVTLALALKLHEGEDLFKADAKRLQQIVSNLIHNAIKFTGDSGQVEVRVWREPRTAVFQIKDTGIGIPESQQDILFEKFKQLESPFQRQYAGTGLGLAMTKRLVELHGGSIQIDSQVGKGSTFTVRLPVQSESMPPSHYQIPMLEEGPKRVILLETDEDNAAIACEMLTAAGYEVIWLVESDQLAMQLNLLRPVMLIADLSLINPNISNIKAIQLAITALNAKVLALTTHSESASASMAHHDILPKPIDPKALLGKVRKLMLAPV